MLAGDTRRERIADILQHVVAARLLNDPLNGAIEPSAVFGGEIPRRHNDYRNLTTFPLDKRD